MKTVLVKRKYCSYPPKDCRKHDQKFEITEKILRPLQLKGILDALWTVPVSQIQSVTSHSIP
jgi:hypothetical protein